MNTRIAEVPLRVRFICWAALLILAIFCAISVDHAIATHAVVFDRHYVGDFTVFWTAARAASNVIYDVDAISEAQAILIGGNKGPRPFLNPPSFLPFLAPMALLPFFPALIAWAVLGIAAFVRSIRDWIDIRHFGLIAISPPFFLAVAAGQVTLFICACIATSLPRLDTRPNLAGVLLGVAATIKPQAVILAPLALVAGRHWRALGAAVAAGLTIGITCLIVQGPQLWLDWLDALKGFSEISKRSYLIGRGATPTSLAYLLGLPPTATLCLIIFGVALGLYTVWVVFRSTEGFLERLTALVAGGILCVPYAMPYEATPLIVPAAIFLLNFNEKPIYWFIGFLLISHLLLPVAVLVMAVAVVFRTRSVQNEAMLRFRQ